MSDIGAPLWYEKYRPKTWEDYVWIDDEFKAKIDGYLKEPGKTPHMCLVGLSGTGKTTLARLLAESIVSDPDDILFVRASIDSGVNMIRDQVEPFCQNAGWSEVRFVILDEAERLKLDVQQQLRNTINAYGDHVRFILTCNSSTRIKEFLDSRIRTIQFDGLDRDKFLERILTILVQEGVNLEADPASLEVAVKVIDRFYPDMRKTIDMLQDCYVDGKLVESKRAARKDQPWMDEVLAHLRTGLNITNLRNQLSDLQPDQIVEVFPILIENATELFGADEPLAIISIRNHMIDHAQAAFPAINLLGLIIELYMIQHAKDRG